MPPSRRRHCRRRPEAARCRQDSRRHPRGRPRPPGDQPRQAALARGGPAEARDQADAAALFHPGLPLDAPPPRRPAAVRHPFSRRHRGEELLPEALGRPAAVRAARVHLLQPRRGRRRLSHLREPAHPALAGTDGQSRDARLVLPHRPRARRHPPRPDIQRLRGRPSRSRCSTIPTSSSSISTPTSTRGREARGAEPELHRQAFNRTRKLALQVRELLERLGLSTWIKTSGRTGLHLYLPIVRDLDFDAARDVAATIAAARCRSSPAEVTIDWAVERRRGKIFFDYNQNAGASRSRCPTRRGATPAPRCRRRSRGTSWSPSIRPTSPCAPCPTGWSEQGDPWDGILEAKHDLGAVLGAGSARDPAARSAVGQVPRPAPLSRPAGLDPADAGDPHRPARRQAAAGSTSRSSTACGCWRT